MFDGEAALALSHDMAGGLSRLDIISEKWGLNIINITYSLNWADQARVIRQGWAAIIVDLSTIIVTQPS